MWENILGHDKQKSFLQNYLKAAERPHALLFVGAEGLGKRQLALEFAKSLLCETHTGADNCEACRLMNIEGGDFSHPDFLLVQREEDPKTKRLKDISIDQIKNLITQAATGAVMSPTRVCLIEDVDKMSVAAANSFLKLLEEPPSGWVMLLIATSADKLLPTILSRVVLLRFQAVELSLVEQALCQQKIDSDKAKVLARISEGSIGKALSLYQNGSDSNVFVYRQQAAAFLEALPLSMPVNYLSGRKWLDGKLLKNEALLLLQLWQLLLHDLLLCKLQLYDKIYNVDLLTELQAQSRGWRIDTLKKSLTHVQAAFVALESNVSSKIVLESLALKIDKTYKE